MGEADQHTIDEIVENMASKLYFHGHPINRQEAKQDLRLKVNLELQPELETAMWDLYEEYEGKLENTRAFTPAGELAAMLAPAAGPAVMTEKEYDLVHVIIESARLSSEYQTRRRYRMHVLGPGQRAIEEDILGQGWNHSTVPQGESAPPSA